MTHQRGLSRKVQRKTSDISWKFKCIVINVTSEALQGDWGRARTGPCVTQARCNEENDGQSYVCFHYAELERGHAVNAPISVFSHAKAAPQCVIPAFPALVNCGDS